MQRLAVIAAGGSIALLLGALAFEHLGGLPPCKLCYWQRYPHVAAGLVGVLIAIWPWRGLTLIGAACATATAAVGGYHVGVEQGWWKGPSTCSSASPIGLSPEELLNRILEAPVVRCDDIAWSLAGISMAGWNAILSLALAAIWITAFRRPV